MSATHTRQARQALRVVHRLETLRSQSRESLEVGRGNGVGVITEINPEVPVTMTENPAFNLPPPLQHVGHNHPDGIQDATDGQHFDTQAAQLHKAASLAFGHHSPRPTTIEAAAPPPVRTAAATGLGDQGLPQADVSPSAKGNARFKDAVLDVQAARNMLATPTGDKPKGADELWKAFDGFVDSLGQAVTSGIGHVGSSLVPDHGAPQGPPPGLWSPRTDLVAIRKLFTSSWLNLLLICIPLGWIAHFTNWGAYAIFILNIVCLIPLALMLGEITEDLALRFGDTVGGLLNATFGNVVELILSIAALVKELYTVVAYSLVGSVLSNLLLVLGMCFLLGGTKYKVQSFNTLVNKASASLLFLASIAIIIPSIGPQLTPDITPDDVRRISHGTAILLAFVYLCYLFFQLKTHHSIFVEEDSGEQPTLSLFAAIGMLGAITAVVAVSSEFLTGALTEVSDMSGISQAFLGLIILPIAGNACEHITAIIVAMKNKMDLAIGVALGSSIQIAVFVIPVVVIVGWIIGKPFLLDFDPFLVVMLTLSVIHAFFVSSDGQSNWLMGVQLIGTYVLIALLVVYK